MGKRVQFELEESEYEELCDIKDSYGLTWKGMVVRGANDISGGEYK
jgi:hypothetical protein